jgi:hypothetical protein
MVADLGRPVVDLAPAVERADEVVEIHIDDGFGWCRGCAVEYAFAVPHPCTARRWADRTHIIAGSAVNTGEVSA